MPLETVDSTRTSFEAEAARLSAEVDRFFADRLADPGDGRSRLFAAMRHAAIGGGKRLRPLLVVAASRLFGIDAQDGGSWAGRHGIADEKFPTELRIDYVRVYAKPSR